MEQNQNNEGLKRNPTEQSEGADQPLLCAGRLVKRNCKNCENLEHDTCEDSWQSYSYCSKQYPKTFLKSFPFEKEQDCHVPGFLAYIEEDPELKELMKKYDIEDIWHRLSETDVYQRFIEKYEEASCT